LSDRRTDQVVQLRQSCAFLAQPVKVIGVGAVLDGGLGRRCRHCVCCGEFSDQQDQQRPVRRQGKPGGRVSQGGEQGRVVSQRMGGK
jgi:hypothetical protein